MRLIDADALSEAIEREYDGVCVYDVTPSEAISDFQSVVDRQPTIQPEKAQLSQEETTSDTISKTETVEHLRRVLEATVPNTDYDEGFIDGVEFGISTVSTMPTIQPEQRWIPCSERLPKCEQEVLVCTKTRPVGKNAYIDSITTPAIYEDGTMIENDSKWRWEDIDYAGWDEEEDCGIIPEGWWENRHFNPDGVFNNPVDQKVIAWMPLPEPYNKERKDDNKQYSI